MKLTPNTNTYKDSPCRWVDLCDFIGFGVDRDLARNEQKALAFNRLAVRADGRWGGIGLEYFFVRHSNREE